MGDAKVGQQEFLLRFPSVMWGGSYTGSVLSVFPETRPDVVSSIRPTEWENLASIVALDVSEGNTTYLYHRNSII